MECISSISEALTTTDVFLLKIGGFLHLTVETQCLPPSNRQASSVHDNLEKKPRFFHLDLGFGLWQTVVETLLCHLDIICHCCQWLYPVTARSRVPGKAHVTATAESSTASGSPRTGVPPWGGQRKGHDSCRRDTTRTELSLIVWLSSLRY